MHHPLRYLIPPLIVLIGVLAIYLPIRRHKIGEREHPHDNPHKPVHHVTAAGVIAGALIVAFVAAFMLP